VANHKPDVKYSGTVHNARQCTVPPDLISGSGFNTGVNVSNIDTQFYDGFRLFRCKMQYVTSYTPKLQISTYSISGCYNLRSKQPIACTVLTSSHFAHWHDGHTGFHGNYWKV